MVEFTAPIEAAGPVIGRLTGVSPVPLALGIGFHLLKLAALGGAWLSIVRAALPGTRVRPRQAITPYLAGTGVNAVVPARAGHATRLVLARRLIPEATYEMLAGAMVAEGLLGVVPLFLLIGAAFATGLLPGALHGVPLAPPASLTPSPPVIGAVLAAVCAVAAGVLGAGAVRRRVTRSLARLRQGLAVVGGGPQLPRALACQLTAWVLRLASIACFLAAFGLRPTPALVVLVVLAQALASLVPVGPAGVGAQEGLIVVVLAGTASTGTALAFGVGMQAAVIAADLLAGVLAVAFAREWAAVLRRPAVPAAAIP